MQNIPAVAVPLDPLVASYLHTAWNESNRTCQQPRSTTTHKIFDNNSCFHMK